MLGIWPPSQVASEQSGALLPASPAILRYSVVSCPGERALLAAPLESWHEDVRARLNMRASKEVNSATSGELFSVSRVSSEADDEKRSDAARAFQFGAPQDPKSARISAPPGPCPAQVRASSERNPTSLRDRVLLWLRAHVARLESTEGAPTEYESLSLAKLLQIRTDLAATSGDTIVVSMGFFLVT